MKKNKEVNYVLLDEAKLNPKLAAYLDKKYDKYIKNLWLYNINKYSTLAKSEEELAKLYEDVSKDLAKYTEEDVIYLYEFIHNRMHYYRDQLKNKSIKLNVHHDAFDGRVYDDESKEKFINDPVKENYQVFASKNWILEKVMKLYKPELLELAQKKFRNEISAILGYNPWIAKEGELERQ